MIVYNGLDVDFRSLLSDTVKQSLKGAVEGAKQSAVSAIAGRTDVKQVIVREAEQKAVSETASIIQKYKVPIAIGIGALIVLAAYGLLKK